MTRYLRLYGAFVKFSVMQATMFRFDFWLRIIMDILYYAISIGIMIVLFEHTPWLGGWNREQVLVFIAGALLLDGVTMTLFNNNFWELSGLINEGRLDYYLVRPVSTLFFVSLRQFAVNSFVNLVLGIAFLIWTINQLPGPVSFGGVALYVILVLNGVLLMYLLRIQFTLPLFWWQSTGMGLLSLFHTVGKVTERPDRIFYGALRWFFVVVFPALTAISLPARLFLDPWDWNVFFTIVGVSIFHWCLTLFLWSRALRAYGSASS